MNDEATPAPGRRVWLYGALVFAAALAARLAYLAQIQQSPYYDVAFDRSSDCFTFYAWALHIYHGDLTGSGVFWQSPLYPYLLGLIFYITGPNLLTPRFVQLVIGAFGAVLVFLLGRRLRGDLAGLLAGLMDACYGPLIFYEGAFLRDGLLAFLNTALVLALIRGREKPGIGRGLLLGLLTGLAIVGKPNIAVMLPVMAVSIMIAGRRDADASMRRTVRLKLAAGSAAGMLIVFGALAARNVKAGAPALSLNQQGAIELISGNVFGGPPYGWLRDQPVLEMADQSRGSIFRAAWLLLKSYQGHYPQLARREAVKTLWFLSGYEAPNNMNYYVEKQYVGLMALPWLTWPIVLGLAVVGMAGSRRRWRETFELWAYVVLFSAATVAFYYIDRFRIPLVPAMCAFAGAGAWEIASAARQKRWSALAAGLAAAIAITAAAWPRVPDPLRVNDYRYLAHCEILKGRPDQARAVIEKGRARAEKIAARHGGAEARLRLAQLLYVEGAPLDAVQAVLEKAQAMPAPRWISEQIASTLNAVKERRENDPKPDGLRI